MSYAIIRVLCVSCLYAQGESLLSVNNIPTELVENANDIIRFEDRRLTIESAKTAYLYCRKVITILKTESNQNTIYIPYDEESQVRKISAAIYDAGGSLVRRVARNEIEDYSAVSDFSIYEDDRYKYLKLSHNSYPYTIEFEYELSVQGISICHSPNWYIQQYSSSIQQAKYLIKVPSKSKIHFKALNCQLKPVIEEKSGTTFYTWEVKNRKAEQSEQYSPNDASILPKLLVSLDNFRINQYTGSLRSWKDFGFFIYQLSEDRDQLSASMEQEVKHLTANTTSDREKIEILYKYLQQNMRYVSVQLGIGGWQPVDATYVEKNKYGDCKALTNFMKALLKVVGIQSYAVLIYNSDNPSYSISTDFAAPRFNHVILRIPSEDIWLECTSTNYPMNYIGINNANRTALMITSKGGELVETPSYTSNTNQEQHQFEIYLNEEGGASMKGIVNCRGSKHEIYRALASHYSQEDFKKWYQRKSSLPNFQLEQFLFKAAVDSPSCQLQLELSISRYMSKTGKRLFVPINKINAFSNNLQNYDNRQHPVVLPHGFVEEDTFTFYLPESYQLESIPKNIHLDSNFGTYILTVEKKDNQVFIQRKLTLFITKQDPEKYTALQDFFKTIAKSDAGNMVLVKKRS